MPKVNYPGYEPEPVFVLTKEDAKTVLWAEKVDQELRGDQGELGLSGVVEWNMLVDKAKACVALDEILETAAAHRS